MASPGHEDLGSHKKVNSTNQKQKYNIMSANEILLTLRALAQSSGRYGSICEELESNVEAMDYLEAQNFRGPIDLVLFIEG